MRKFSTYIFAFSTCILSAIVFFLWMKLDSNRQKVVDREHVISTYLKIIEAIGRTNDVNIEDLKKELAEDFDINNKPFGCCDEGLLYHTILTRNEEDLKIAGDYMGGAELITDTTNQLKTVVMYKP